MRMRRSTTILLSASLVCAAGCASIPASQVGQTLGTVVGAVVAPGVGAPVGAAIGLIGGMLVQGRIDKVTETRERKELGDQLGQPASSVQTADTTPSSGDAMRVWVDEAVENGRVIPAHFDVHNLRS